MAKKSKERVAVDVPRVTRDEAVELVIHHLRLAAMFFEATPDDDAQQLHDEIMRISKGETVAPWRDAALKFCHEINAIYNKMAEED